MKWVEYAAYLIGGMIGILIVGSIERYVFSRHMSESEFVFIAVVIAVILAFCKIDKVTEALADIRSEIQSLKDEIELLRSDVEAANEPGETINDEP